MPNHWTYTSFQPSDDLSQGDIIARNDRILGILGDIHAYFRNLGRLENDGPFKAALKRE